MKKLCELKGTSAGIGSPMPNCPQRKLNSNSAMFGARDSPHKLFKMLYWCLFSSDLGQLLQIEVFTLDFDLICGFFREGGFLFIYVFVVPVGIRLTGSLVDM